MSSRLKFVGNLIRKWYIWILSFLTAFMVWLYVAIKEKVPFQLEIPIKDIPPGVVVFPDKVLIAGKISEKLNTKDVLNCFKVSLKWKKGEKYAIVIVKSPLPKPFIEIESVFPQKVEVQKKKTP